LDTPASFPISALKILFMVDYSTKRVGIDLIEEIKQALKDVKGWGSVEIFIQDHKVTQITSRNIKKTNHNLSR
jgi:hypothetical protein